MHVLQGTWEILRIKISISPSQWKRVQATSDQFWIGPDVSTLQNRRKWADARPETNPSTEINGR